MKETAAVTRADEQELAAHLEQLPGWQNRWALWKCVGLRGAGFAAANVLRLGSEDSAQAADELIAAEEKAEETWELAIAAVNEALDAMPWDAEGYCEDKRVLTLFKARRSLKRGKPPQVYDAATTEGQAIKNFVVANTSVDDSHAEFVRRFEAAQVETKQVIREMASEERFREAVTWQNRRGLHTGIDSLLRRPANTALSKQRSSEELIASYWQRYCTKNDSIGFFGPVGWATIDSSYPDIKVHPGPALLASREVYLECWCVDALCRQLAKDERLRPWFVPRRLPSIRLEGRMLHRPLREARQLSIDQALVLEACDGERTAKRIASELLGSPSTALHSEQQIYQLLAELEQMNLIVWKLEVPDDQRSELKLRALLEAVPDDEVRERALGVLQKLEGARREVVEAAGDAQRLDRALAAMEDFFTEETSQEATRLEGKLYAGRTLLYEDCRRDIDVILGSELIKSLSGALGLLLESARWVVVQIAEEFRSELHRLYLQLAQKTGETAVEASIFWLYAEPLLVDQHSELVENVIKRFQEKWARILPLDSEARRVCFSSDDLRSLVEKEFPASKTGWQDARYHSPDVMIAAENADAIRRGDYEFILGEIHVSKNTLGGLAALMQHPEPEELYRNFATDMLPRVVNIYPKDEQHPIRTAPAFKSPQDFFLEHSTGSPGVPATRTLKTAALVVESSGSDLFVRTRDRKLKFDVIEFFGGSLSALVTNILKLFAPREHVPRVNIDRLVVQRESWSLPASSLVFACERLDADRFVEARRFARAHKMPRHVFVKVPVEAKPVYVDFASGMYVNILSKLIRRSIAEGAETRVVFSEMLPGIGEAWLPDAAGKHYTSEFRFVALDLVTQ